MSPQRKLIHMTSDLASTSTAIPAAKSQSPWTLTDQILSDTRILLEARSGKHNEDESDTYITIFTVTETHELVTNVEIALQYTHDELAESAMWEIRKIHYQAFDEKVDVRNLGHDDKICPICLMEYEGETLVRKEERKVTLLYDMGEDNRQPIKLTCGHVFGMTCIEKWLCDNDGCPLCRTTLLGKGRKLKYLSPQSLSCFKTFNMGKVLLYYEDIDFDWGLHEDIMRATERGSITAWILLQFQFQRLQEIDTRLGASKRTNRVHTRTTSPVARWMDEDWDMFACNARNLREYLKEQIRLHPAFAADPLTMNSKMELAEMLTAHRERARL